MKYKLHAAHLTLPDIKQSFVTEVERVNFINDITKIGYSVIETVDADEWEEFQIEITHDGVNFHTEDEMSEVTERFESELYRLVKKYQGQAGLTFYARNSEGEIVEY